MQPFISVVIPVYNSENSLEELCYRLREVLSDINPAFEIIMVDDVSSDGSIRIMKQIREQDHRVKIISLEYNAGQNNAIFCGLEHSSGKYVLTIDDDLQHPPEEIIRLFGALEKGTDTVFGIPLKRQQAFYRNLGSELVNICLTLITKKPIRTRVSSYRLLTQDTAAAVISQPRAFIYLSALILNHTSSIVNVSIQHHKRKYGKSNYNMKSAVNLVSKLMIHYSYIPVAIILALWTFLAMFSSILPADFVIGAVGLLLIASLYITREYWRRFTWKDTPPYKIKEKIF